MVTYYEVKNLFSRIICGRNLEEDNDNDIIIDRSRFRGLSSSQEGNQITIKNTVSLKTLDITGFFRVFNSTVMYFPLFLPL